jgi:hypothetical protein
MSGKLTRVGSANTAVGGSFRQVDVFCDSMGEMYFVDLRANLVFGGGDQSGKLLGKWEPETQTIGASDGTTESAAAAAAADASDSNDDSNDSNESGSESAQEKQTKPSKSAAAAVKPVAAKTAAGKPAAVLTAAITEERFAHATLSDRLNPSHPAFDAALKARWKKMAKQDREELVKEDRIRLQTRRDTIAAIEHPFEANDDDHCETSMEAYGDLAPLLEHLAQSLGKTRAELSIYDPYFCTGSVVAHLARFGFDTVYNKCEDFYEVAEAGKTPEYDVLVTNPAYSGEHIPRLLEFVAKSGKPFCLLLPSYVVQKDYFTAAQEKHISMRQLMYLYPRKRYVYWAPKGLRSKTQSHASVLGSRTSPFSSFWFVFMGQHQDRVAKWWRQNIEAKCMCGLARALTRLPPALSGIEPTEGSGHDRYASRKREYGQHRGGHDRSVDRRVRGKPERAVKPSDAAAAAAE